MCGGVITHPALFKRPLNGRNRRIRSLPKSRVLSLAERKDSGIRSIVKSGPTPIHSFYAIHCMYFQVPCRKVCKYQLHGEIPAVNRSTSDSPAHDSPMLISRPVRADS